MANSYVGKFSRYTPAPGSEFAVPGAVSMRNEKGVDLYAARNRLGEGLFLVTGAADRMVVSAAAYPFVPFPGDGQRLWHNPALGSANEASAVGKSLDDL